MSNPLKGKHIVLGVSGGIAAYKSVELLRLLTKQDADVRVIMTRNAQAFVGWMTFEALSGNPVCADLFQAGSDASIKHIDWAREADAVVIAPATANTIGKMANGIADDALSTFIMAVTSPICVCPSMNTHMYESHAVQRNLTALRNWGVHIVEPTAGQLACGTVGPGRLAEPTDILDRLINVLTPKDMAGVHVLITAGPTHEAIDPVRYISNPSSGKMGYAIAKAAEQRGAAVTLVSGPSQLPDPTNVNVIRVHSAGEMAQAVFDTMTSCQVIVKAAAVGDYRPEIYTDHKIKKTQQSMTLELIPNPDILKEIGRRKHGQFVVGFAAETDDLEKNAQKKLAEKNLDIIVGNLIGPANSGFAVDTNTVTFFYKDGTSEVFSVMEKDAVAHVLLDRVVTHIKTDESTETN